MSDSVKKTPKPMVRQIRTCIGSQRFVNCYFSWYQRWLGELRLGELYLELSKKMKEFDAEDEMYQSDPEIYAVDIKNRNLFGRRDWIKNLSDCLQLYNKIIDNTSNDDDLKERLQRLCRPQRYEMDNSGWENIEPENDHSRADNILPIDDQILFDPNEMLNAKILVGELEADVDREKRGEDRKIEILPLYEPKRKKSSCPYFWPSCMKLWVTRQVPLFDLADMKIHLRKLARTEFKSDNQVDVHLISRGSTLVLGQDGVEKLSWVRTLVQKSNLNWAFLFMDESSYELHRDTMCENEQTIIIPPEIWITSHDNYAAMVRDNVEAYQTALDNEPGAARIIKRREKEYEQRFASELPNDEFGLFENWLLILKKANVNVVVLDSLVGLLEGKTFNVSTFRKVSELAKKLNLVLIVIHHTSQKSEGAGKRDFFNVFEAILSIEEIGTAIKTDESVVALEFLKSKLVEEKKLVYLASKFTGNSISFEEVTEADFVRKGSSSSSLSQLILGFIAQQEERQTSFENLLGFLCSHKFENPVSIKNALKVLASAGLVKMTDGRNWKSISLT